MKTSLLILFLVWAGPLGAAEAPLPLDLTGSCRVLPDICAAETDDEDDEAPEDDGGVKERGMGLTRSAACREAQDAANLECTNSMCLGCAQLDCDCVCILDDINCICVARGVACVVPGKP